MDTPSPRAPTVCYRHPDRTTRLSCSECGRPICVDCSHDAVVGQKCPECAKPIGRATVIDARGTIGRPSTAATRVTFGIIAVNALIFLAGMASPDLELRLRHDFAQFNPLISVGEWYRAFTAIFLHANATHILFNMWALYVFGPVLERRFGAASFGSLYVAGGLSGGALFYLIGGNSLAVGASGAIFSLFGAMLAASYRQRHTPAGRAVFGQLAILLALNMALPFVIRNIAWEAHVGGLLAGMLIATAWDHLPLHGKDAALRRVAVASAIAVVMVLVLLIA